MCPDLRSRLECLQRSGQSHLRLMTHTKPSTQHQLHLFSAVGSQLKHGQGQGFLGDFNGQCPPEDVLPVRFQRMGWELCVIVPRPEPHQAPLGFSSLERPLWSTPTTAVPACFLSTLELCHEQLLHPSSPSAPTPHIHTRPRRFPGKSFSLAAPLAPLLSAQPSWGLQPWLAALEVSLTLCSPIWFPNPSLSSSKEHSLPSGSSAGTATLPMGLVTVTQEFTAQPPAEPSEVVSKGFAHKSSFLPQNAVEAQAERCRFKILKHSWFGFESPPP